MTMLSLIREVFDSYDEDEPFQLWIEGMEKRFWTDAACWKTESITRYILSTMDEEIPDPYKLTTFS